MSAFKGLDRSDVTFSDHVARKHWTFNSLSDFEKEGIGLFAAYTDLSQRSPSLPAIVSSKISSSIFDIVKEVEIPPEVGPGHNTGSGIGPGTGGGTRPIIGPRGSSNIGGNGSSSPTLLLGANEEDWYFEYESPAVVLHEEELPFPAISLDPKELFASIRHSFYSGSLTDILNQDPFSPTSSFSGSSADVDSQTSITVFGSRTLEYLPPGNDIMYILNIPKSVFGMNIVEGSIRITSTGIEDVYDKEGVLVQGDKIIGDVIYNKGLLIFRGPEWPNYLIYPGSYQFQLQFDSAVPVFTYDINCKVRDLEFNYSYNKSISEENLIDPDWTPYVTAIGLYNDVHELLAVAKLSKPIKKAKNIDTTFKIQLDI